MNQIEKGYDKVDRPVKVIDDGGNIRFAKDRSRRIAAILTASCESLAIRKDFKACPITATYEYDYALRWAMCCEISNVTLSELNAMRELLGTFVGSDQMKLQKSLDCLSFDFGGDAVIDAKNGCLKIEAIMRVPATAVVDQAKISAALSENGFVDVARQQANPTPEQEA